MGLKEAEGLYYQIIIRAVPRVPPGWGSEEREKKSYCVENQVVVTALVDSKSVTDPHSLPFIYL